MLDCAVDQSLGKDLIISRGEQKLSFFKFSQTAVLTAAHCTTTGVVGYTIIAGAVDRTQIEPQQQRWTNLPTSAFVPHPNYGPVLLRNDIAVIRFVSVPGSSPFVWTNAVQPIQLASDNTDRHEGVLATVSGASLLLEKISFL